MAGYWPADTTARFAASTGWEAAQLIFGVLDNAAVVANPRGERPCDFGHLLLPRLRI